MLTDQEIALARASMEFALAHGAQKARVTLNKSLMELFGMLNGELDKVTHALDRSLQVALFVDGRFGSFSSNRLEEEGLKKFLLDAIDTVRTLQPDPARDLPDPARTAKDAQTGRELDLYDPAYEELTSDKRRELALDTAVWKRKAELEKGFTLISEEGEYSDSLFDSVVMDSNGLYARHTETSFEIGYEVTVEDPDGNRYASYWWDATPRLKDILPSLKTCSETAVRRAAAQIGPMDHPGGKCSIVVDSECASKFLTPVLNALGGYAVQQKNSFLVDKAGTKVFPDCLTVLDCPRSAGQTGSRLFDSEGRRVPACSTAKASPRRSSPSSTRASSPGISSTRTSPGRRGWPRPSRTPRVRRWSPSAAARRGTTSCERSAAASSSPASTAATPTPPRAISRTESRVSPSRTAASPTRCGKCW